MLWFIVGSVGAVMSASVFFMVTAFGGGGLVAPGRSTRGIGPWFTISIIAGPIGCIVFGILAWITGRPAWFAGPPLLVVAQFVVILCLFGRR